MTDTKKIKETILALLESYSAVQLEIIVGHLDKMHHNKPTIAEISSAINEMVNEELIKYSSINKNYSLIKEDNEIYSAPIWLLDHCKSPALKEYIVIEDPELSIQFVKEMIEGEDVTLLTRFISSISFSDNLSKFPKGLNVNVGRIIHGVHAGSMISFSIIVKEQQAPLEL